MDRELNRYGMIDLFSGLNGWSQPWIDRGIHTTRIDLADHANVTLRADILTLTPSKIHAEHGVEYVPELVAASPPCTSFSVASIQHHWNKEDGVFIPKSDAARLGLKLMNHAFEILDYFASFGVPCILENPRGVMRKVAPRPPDHTITYCKYGDNTMKPTDLWTWNMDNWEARPACKRYRYDSEGNIINRHCHHEVARRGMSTGLQGKKKRDPIRSLIPIELAMSVFKSCSASGS